MLGFSLVNDTTDPAITSDVLTKGAGLLARYMSLVTDVWQRLPLRVGTAEKDAAVPAGFTAARFVDQLDDPNALAYHAIGPDGRPVILIGWGVIKSNGGTMFGPDGGMSAVGHELAEAAVDPYTGFWSDMLDGTEVALEVADPVQGQDFEVDSGSGLFAPNFVTPRWFSEGPGPYDYLRRLSSAFQVASGGYIIKRAGGPGGTTTDVFGAEPHQGGMPEWKRLAKTCAGSRRTRRHG